MKFLSLFFLFVCVVLVDQVQSEAPSSWLNLNIENPDPSVVEKLKKTIQEIGHIYIPNFLKPETISAFKEELAQTGENTVFQVSSIYQDDGDHENFTSPTHPRNRRMTRTLHFSPRIAIEKTFYDPSSETSSSRLLDLYQSQALLNFWRSLIPPEEHIYISHDSLGSVYGLKIEPKASPEGNWHVDEHRYSCVFMLQKPTGGGYFQHSKFSNAWLHKTDQNWDRWNDIDLLISGKSDLATFPVHEVRANDGDVYCFFGNEEIHNIVDVEGEIDRIVTVFTYSNVEGFSHSGHVHDKNEWERRDEKEPDCVLFS